MTGYVKNYRMNERTGQLEEIPPLANSIDEILSQFKNYKFERVCGNLWERNVFVLFGHAIVYFIITFKAICNRIKRSFIWCKNKIKKWINRKKQNSIKKGKIVVEAEKIFKSKYIQYIHDKSLLNIWKISGIAFFLLGFAIGKLIYHITMILTWIFVHIIRPVLKWAVVVGTILLSVAAISGKSNEQQKH